MNLVFLIDKSGSMQPENKLPLIKQALRLLVKQLTARDRVAIVVYADSSRVLLPSTPGDDHATILAAIEELTASGSTNGGAGIQAAYEQATRHFIEKGVNRVLLCTDGDFNVGTTGDSELTRLIKQQAETGVFLSVFGFGMGNLKDATLERLADKGNGQYAYIDDIAEARKALVDDLRSTLITVAKDVKLQVEFNPARVHSYRLIGYENRVLAARDFHDDRKDAGDLGAGHTVTALYEIIPAVGDGGGAPLKYQPARQFGDEWLSLKLRYKEPDADKSQLLTAAIKDTHLAWRNASEDFRFAAAVAAFGMVLRQSPHRGDADFDLVLRLADSARRRDPNGYRREFVELVGRACQLTRVDR
jgi:Ca-activated chloride channel family protein